MLIKNMIMIRYDMWSAENVINDALVEDNISTVVERYKALWLAVCKGEGLHNAFS